MPTDSATAIYYTVQGQGPCVILGFPYLASYEEVMPAEMPDVSASLAEALASDFQVLCLDYPSIGRSRDIPGHHLTADRVAEDLLSVADHAGFARFSYFGYSWGAAAGLQLAARTDRIEALIIGGWPPLGAQYNLCLQAAREQLHNPPPEVRVVLRSPEQYAQWVNFYESLTDFDERALLKRLSTAGTACLAFVGAEGDVGAGDHLLSNATILRREESALHELGWQIDFIERAGHEVGLDADAVLRVIQPFLESTLCQKNV
ncbi:MAG: alpha/beta hydrolase [Pseudomonadota bacterium]